jgi:hypothetical protein
MLEQYRLVFRELVASPAFRQLNVYTLTFEIGQALSLPLRVIAQRPRA